MKINKRIKKIITWGLILYSLTTPPYQEKTNLKIENCEKEYQECIKNESIYFPQIKKYFLRNIGKCNIKYEKCKEKVILEKTYKQINKFDPYKNRYVNLIKRDHKKENETNTSLKNKILNYLSNAEKEFGFPKNYLINIAKVESSLNPYAKSNKGAYGMLQITKVAFEDLKKTYKLSKTIVENKVNKKSLKKIDIKNPLSWELVRLKKNSNIPYSKRKDIMYYYTPIYLAFNRHRRLLKEKWNHVKRDPKLLAEAGVLYMYKLRVFFETAQILKIKNKYMLIRRSPSHFIKYPKLKALGSNMKYLWIIYNRGKSIGLNTLLKYGHIYGVLRNSPRETKKGFKKLSKLLSNIGNRNKIE